ncbi:MAG: hypothetical protein RIR70_524 [Pseudomonadota bacterium]|jgi:hydrogenase/urease accessory protein HupE
MRSLFASALLLPLSAHAHPGHVHTLLDIFTHALTEWDHLALGALALAAVFAVRRLKQRTARG